MKTFGLNYDIQHNNRVELIARNVNQLYLNTIRDITRLAEIYNIDISKPFVFSEYPEINRQVDKLISNLSAGIKGTIDYGTKNEWIAACKKNDFLIESLAKSTGLKPERIAGYSNRNIEALQSFQTRKIGGLNLSEKVWKYANQFKGDIELGIDIGIGDGRSAAELSRDLRSYLQEPQKLFRRVADKHGVLRLSQNAKKYSPDTGVYRSSYKNAMRLTRTEVNMAYRTSDYERIQELDFVVGIEIRRSNHIFACPVCEALKGKYPKTFKFTGWHPQCRCHQISILATNEEFMNQQKALLDGNEIELKSKNEVSDVPDNFKQWIKDNQERIDNAKSKPFFINDNPKFTNAVEKQKQRLLADETIADLKKQIGVDAKYSFDEIESKIELDKLITRDNVQRSGLTYQGYIGEIQGFNELPKVVDSIEFESLLKDETYIPIFRGFRENGDVLVANFKTGKLYEGLGAYGNGSYFGTRESVALSYTTGGNKNHIIYAVFDKKNTKIANYDELKDAWYKDRQENIGNISAVAKKHFNVDKISQIPYEKLDDFEILKKSIYDDFGSWATAKGYDMIYVNSEDFYVMLNRTKLIVLK
jgi:hypothetical protein